MFDALTKHFEHHTRPNHVPFRIIPHTALRCASLFKTIRISDIRNAERLLSKRRTSKYGNRSSITKCGLTPMHCPICRSVEKLKLPIVWYRYYMQLLSHSELILVPRRKPSSRYFLFRHPNVSARLVVIQYVFPYSTACTQSHNNHNDVDDNINPSLSTYKPHTNTLHKAYLTHL